MNSMPRELVLVADDDEDIVRFVEVNLRLEGFDVRTVADGQQALEETHELMPDLVLLDVMMPKLDGFEVCQRLRSDTRTKHISVIMLTAKSLSADKVVGLTTGADDYMIKPFDPLELVARVKSTLRRSREMRGINPLTQLPGNAEIQKQIAERVAEEAPLAVLYIDLDNFKAYNDHYGFMRGDEMLKLVASCASEALNDKAPLGSFLGHIGGDDFVAIVDPDRCEEVASYLIGCWDRRAPALYDPEDAAKGCIEVADRKGELHTYPITTISIGIASNATRPLESHWEASEIASEMKQFAKREAVSSYARDRRRGAEEGSGYATDRRRGPEQT